MGVSVEFTVLGPLQVRSGPRQVDIGGQRQQRILAALLLNVGRPVGVAELIAAVWDDDPPPTARRQVQTAIWQLRKISPVEGSSAGYRLDVVPQQVDLCRFEAELAEGTRLAALGEAAAAAAHLRAAVSLWNGPTLGGVGGAVAERAAARIDQLRLTAIEQCVDCELASGDRPTLLAELTDLVDAHPLSERLAAAYMLALYRAGRQADALHAYRRIAAVLADELGIDPGPYLSGRHTAILRRDPALDPTGQLRPAQLPTGTAVFVGRDSSLRHLDAVTNPVVTIDGTAGVGKTALAVHWAHRVRHRFPDGQIYLDLRGFDATAPPVTPDTAVRALLDAFAVPADRIPAGLDPQTALYRSILAGKRVLVVLDNARDVAQVRPLLPGAAGCLAVVTSRNRLTGLVAREGAHPMSLDPFTAERARQLLDVRIGADRTSAAGPGTVDDIIARCAGLPLALAIVAARAVTRPHLSLDVLAKELRHARLDAFDDDDASTDVRAVLSWSYRLLREPAARLFRLLALHPGPDLTASAAANLAGCTLAQVRAPLADLCHAHLLADHPNGRYSQHDLLRAYATELTHELDTDLDLAVRRMLDHYLHTSYAACRLKYPFLRLRTPDPPVPGVTLEVPATEEAALAWFVAENQVLLATIRRAAEAGLHVHTWQLAHTLTDFLNVIGRWTELAAAEELALAATRHLGDRPAQASAHRLLGHVCLGLGRQDDADAHFENAFALYTALGDREGQARIHHYLAQASDRRDRHDEALEYARQALALYEDIDHKLGQASMLNTIAWTHVRTGDSRPALALCEQALRLHDEIGDPYGEMATQDTLGYAHHHLGEYERALACYRRALDLATTLGNYHNRANALLHLADTHQAAGDPAAARAAREQALAIFTDLGHAKAETVRTLLQD